VADSLEGQAEIVAEATTCRRQLNSKAAQFRWPAGVRWRYLKASLPGGSRRVGRPVPKEFVAPDWAEVPVFHTFNCDYI